MTSFSDWRVRAAAAVLSGFLLALVTMLDPMWWAAWIAPIPLLIAAFRSSAREAALLTVLTALLGATGIASFYVSILGVAGGVAVILILALVWVAIVLVTRTIVIHHRHGVVVFVYPALWGAMDTVIAAVSPDGAVSSLANSQIDALPVIQIASLTGTAGIVFSFSLFASIIVIASYRGTQLTKPWLAYGVPILAVLAVLGFGIIRIAGPSATSIVPVGLLAFDHDHPAARPTPGDEAAWSAYAAAIPTIAAQGAKIVLLPENISALDLPATERVRALLASAARASAIYLVAGVALLEPAPSTNRAWIFDPSGNLVLEYTKRHLIRGFEGRFAPGRDNADILIDGKRFGVAICKDMDFPAIGSGYSKLGVNAMLVPAWDFKRDEWFHTRPAVLRGVEGGFSVVRAARDGLLAVSDYHGRILSATSTSGKQMASLVAPASLGPGKPTVYASLGNIFGWACLGGAIVSIIWLIFRDRRLAKATPSK